MGAAQPFARRWQDRRVDVVRGTEAHAGSVAEVWLRARKASIPAIPPPVRSDDEVRAYFRDVVLPSTEVWVALDPDVVGLLVLAGDVIDHLYVDPDHQRRGVGTALLDHAKRQRPRGLQLWTFQSNLGAQRFYERHGFAAVEETDGDNEEGAPDVRYRWRPMPYPSR